MELESIKKIVDTEKEADRIQEEAIKKAQKILEKAEESKENNRVYFKGQLETRLKELEKEQKEANEIKITNVKAVSNDKIRKLKNGIQENMEKAVNKVYEEVIKI